LGLKARIKTGKQGKRKTFNFKGRGEPPQQAQLIAVLIDLPLL
jgi:hypothetical protein